jgi:hypothetical protein
MVKMALGNGAFKPASLALYYLFTERELEMNRDIRKKLVKSCRRVVVKAGTRLLTDPAMVARLVEQIKKIRDTGRQVILVSSGAVGTGMKTLGLKRRPSNLSEIQALAAIGQVRLMSTYLKGARSTASTPRSFS